MFMSQKNRTAKEQKEVQDSILEVYNQLIEDESEPYLFREEHQQYLLKALLNLQYKVKYYDTGHPWIIYWIINSLAMTQEENFQAPNLQANMIKFLGQCQDKVGGGFCGGDKQMPQVASTYAAVLSLLIIGTQEAYDLIDRKKMYEFFMRMKNPDGSFRMADLGEIDMRGIYIVVILSSVLNIQTPELLENVADYIGKCQTYEGGIGPVPYAEAHGGLTFCAVAALCELKQLNKINVNKLVYWAVNRQMQSEGGFQGRTNKLVDCCYSFWMGAIFNLLPQATHGKISYNNELVNNQRKLQMYCLICQNEDGGLFDKPGKPADLYHTCYSLSGLSLSQKRPYTYHPEEIEAQLKQNVQNEEEQKEEEKEDKNEYQQQSDFKDSKTHLLIWNAEENLLDDTEPIFNIPPQKLKSAREYFSKQPNIKELLQKDKKEQN